MPPSLALHDLFTSLMRTSLNDAILALHAGCRQRTVQEFKAWALDIAASVVPFTGAHWGNGVLVDGGFLTFDSELRGLHPDYERCFNECLPLDTRSMEIMARAGTTVLRDGHDPLDTPAEYRRRVLDPSGMRYGAATCIMSFPGGVVEGIALLRGVAEVPFSEAERVSLEALMPHLQHTRVVNQVERAGDILDAGARASYHSIVCTRDALIVAAEAEALAMVLQEWPVWQSGRLPAPLVGAVASANATGEPAMLRGSRVVARIHPHDSQTLVRLRAPSVVDSLGARELMVAERYAGGATYKEIAQSLQLSPSTVNNQLSVVFAKLGVSSKSGLARALEQWR